MKFYRRGKGFAMNEKLVKYVLQKQNGNWRLILEETEALVQVFPGYTRKQAEADSADLLKDFWKYGGQTSELKIRDMAGQYSPARTYPRKADPKRSKG